MQVDLSGLRALVTGSTKGIGCAIAEALAENGAEVAINGRKADEVERAIKDIRGKIPEAGLVAAPGDVASGVIHSDDSQIVRSSSSSRHESRDRCERHTSRPPSA